MEFIKKGNWFLPNNSDKVPGIISFSNQDGGSLETIGSVVPINFFSQSKAIDIILGETLEGELITLFDCFILNQSAYSRTGNSTAKYYCNFIIIGKHFISSSEICFDNIQCQIPSLINWVNHSGFNDLQFGMYEKIRIEYNKPEDFKIEIDDEKTLFFKFDQFYSWTTILTV